MSEPDIDAEKAFMTDEMFSAAYQWQDKPHRHVFDLCAWVDRLETDVA